MRPFSRSSRRASFDRLNVVNPQYVKDLNAALTTLPIEAWRRYLQWRLLSESAGLLSKPFVDENFRFYGQTLSGQKELRPRWKRCTTLVAGQLNDFSLGELIGVEFAKEHFGPDARARMAELIAGLERALAQDIKDIDWMGAETKQRALVKLKAFSKKIGAPDRIRDYSAVKTSRGDLVASRRSVEADAFHYELSQIGKPVDRTEWGMTAQEVNAYYAAPLNEIAFPAGILQPPYFDVTKDDAVNFGAIGAVIGHEITHGFDDEGRKYDAQGNLTDWWTAEDDTRFRERADCVSKQYSGFTAIGDMKLRGDLELGENVADNGGVRIAYMALLEQLVKRPAPEKIDGYTPHQRFFLGWAQSWCENNTDELLRRRVQEDVHSPGVSVSSVSSRIHPSSARRSAARRPSPWRPRTCAASGSRSAGAAGGGQRKARSVVLKETDRLMMHSISRTIPATAVAVLTFLGHGPGRNRRPDAWRRLLRRRSSSFPRAPLSRPQAEKSGPGCALRSSRGGTCTGATLAIRAARRP